MSQNSGNCKVFEASAQLIEYFMTQFGLPSEIFENKSFYRLGNSTIIYMCEGKLPDLKGITQPGMPVFKGEFPKGYPTNAFIYSYGKFATSNTLEVENQDLEKLLNRDGVMYKPDLPTYGPQIVRLKSKILGRGWTRDRLLYLDASKIWRQNLLD